MIIGVAGPYSAPNEKERQENLFKLNAAAARLLEMGHTPLIGINAALPVTALSKLEDHYKYNMEISMAVINACEAILILGESKGANMERDLILSKGLPVYYSLEEVPSSVK